MSSETSTTVQSVVWAGLTFGFAWIIFGIMALVEFVTTVLLTDIYFLATLGGVAIVMFLLDIADQKRALNVILMAVLCGAFFAAMMFLNYLLLPVVVLGIIIYPFAAVIAERIVRVLPI